MRKLNGYVAVDGKVYGPEDDVPAEVAKKITNPKAWAEESGDEPGNGGGKAKGGTSTGARLAGYVQVDGYWYGPDDEVPADVAERITNPKAWEGGKLPDPPKKEPQPAPPSGSGGKASDGAGTGGPDGAGAGTSDGSTSVEQDADGGDKGATPTGDETGGTQIPPPPPRSGRGSGAEAWAAWARHVGVAVAEGASREDIIAACEAANVLEPDGK